MKCCIRNRTDNGAKLSARFAKSTRAELLAPAQQMEEEGLDTF